MTVQAQHDAQYWAERREAWLRRVDGLMDQVARWSRAEGWTVAAETRRIRERLLGEYEVPVVRITLPGGELDGALEVVPVGVQVHGGDGRVDIHAFPTLHRVKLVGHEGGWRVITDSGIPLRQPWEAATFIQMARDMVA